MLLFLFLAVSNLFGGNILWQDTVIERPGGVTRVAYIVDNSIPMPETVTTMTLPYTEYPIWEEDEELYTEYPYWKYPPLPNDSKMALLEMKILALQKSLDRIRKREKVYALFFIGTWIWCWHNSQ